MRRFITSSTGRDRGSPRAATAVGRQSTDVQVSGTPDGSGRKVFWPPKMARSAVLLFLFMGAHYIPLQKSLLWAHTTGF